MRASEIVGLVEATARADNQPMAPVSLSAGMAVFGALARTSLCAACIAKRAGLPLGIAVAELAKMNATRDLRERPRLGPIDAHCLRCEAPRPVYRLT
jgi:hypothetical protein